MYHNVRSRSSLRQLVPARISGVRFLKRKQVFDIANNVALISRAAGAIRARDLRARNFSACGYTNARLCSLAMRAPPLFIFYDRIHKKPYFAYVTARRSNREFVGEIARNFESSASKNCGAHMPDTLLEFL